MQTKWMNCKQCSEEVEVPVNRASVVCADCGRKNLENKDREVVLTRVQQLVSKLEAEASERGKLEAATPILTKIREQLPTSTLQQLHQYKNQIEMALLCQGIRQFISGR